MKVFVLRLWYQSVKLFLKISLNFYAKKIKISGKEHIPRKGAVLFAVNHPNALLDPLFVTTFNPRVNHFLVRADVFKKPLIRKLLSTLNLMPIYRIRDGRKQLSNNDEVFKKCFDILTKNQTLIIFPQGGHCRDRTIQPLSKGFTRIVFGALEQNNELDIAVVPVGITYQNSSTYPCKVAVNYGKPIDARAILQSNPKPKAINIIKNQVSSELKRLTVHIPNDENYKNTLQQLNDANVDFTKVEQVNELINTNNLPKQKVSKRNYLLSLFYLIILNSLLPYLFWKSKQKNIKEQEFVDTFRYGLNVITFPLYYFLQGFMLSFFFTNQIVLIYLIASFFSVLVYTKFANANTEN